MHEIDNGNIPWEFEYKDINQTPGYIAHECVKHIRVMEKFYHHYTKEIMYHVRISYIHPIFKSSVVLESILSYPEISNRYSKKV
jgi:hypothetical protein